MPSLLVYFRVPVSRGSRRVPEAQPLAEFCCGDGCRHVPACPPASLLGRERGSAGPPRDPSILVQRAVPRWHASSVIQSLGPEAVWVGRKTPPRVTRNGALTHLAPEGLAVRLTALCNTQAPGLCARSQHKPGTGPAGLRSSDFVSCLSPRPLGSTRFLTESGHHSSPPSAGLTGSHRRPRLPSFSTSVTPSPGGPNLPRCTNRWLCKDSSDVLSVQGDG